MARIYIHNKPLFLVDHISKEVEEYLHRPETIFIDDFNAAAVKTMLHELEQPQFYTGVFLHNNVDALLAAFKEQLNVIIAAGGLVHTAENDVLLIHRLGHWDLPKGKLDEGESLEACALREIEEETGAYGLAIEQPLQTTYHTYRQNGKNNLKESHWYLVKAVEKTPLTPQTAEDVAQCLWVPLADVPRYIDGAYASVAAVLKEGIRLLQK
ncbi:NUDIX hydrolase [Flavisolibacter nicotianae]|uniref:NUDIX hydrolase n=1 Tax=Flavisolibacter nicotianae TaxID=2364882 RepID=UPI000EB41A70|nr:NUDIX domain-containing protein [Flavisolibacter nicotianae]